MPLSTSSSNAAAARPGGPGGPGGLTRGTWLLFALTALLLTGVELVSNYGFNHISAIQRRTVRDIGEARRLRSAPPGQPATALFAGNSLMLHGIDVERLQSGVSAEMRPTFLPVESTYYHDFYYGLENLLRHGMRPQYVILCLGPTFMVSTQIRGEYSAHYLFDAQGIVEYVRETHTHPTEASSLLFAHFSAFYGGRKEMRSYLLTRLIPGFFEMIKRLTYRHGIVPNDAELSRDFEVRLRALRDLCARYGARFIYVIMPSRQAGEDATLEAGIRTGVPVLLPVRNFSLPKDYYIDEFHLNEKGAAVFSDALAGCLSRLVRSGHASPTACDGRNAAAVGGTDTSRIP
ncbi:MAG: hypothetical protein GZ088_02880 [Acidipila sp.]|nr:hypothetical protein [Acidipila sp.]